ncbi:acetate--CoA ligase family protein [Mycolicibacterium sp. 050158]|uniref:acetate--CoA ligase family protein n=1 Tax=Mycolicibacterium sp. 050158 TaxID=3090602 RepID=UPI00299E6666|nr:acetate--CoA ligase family protein [Mycolicibacterium sp. 050158]MDX1892373.1 acetate--CoA ligase family protein [Mycolicibacterium sp. 050158]
MLGAKSVAIVGASARPDSFGARMIAEARRGSARMHLVNPRYPAIGDLPCAPSIADLDEPVDLVLLGVPDGVLVEQVSMAADAGARSAVVFGAANGVRDEVAAVAGAAGMALCGAGCMGFVNIATGVRALGYLEPEVLPSGGVSLLSHSGSAFSTLLRSRRGFGFRLAVSSGQELVTDTADYVEYALADPGTEVLALVLETPRRAPRLRGALRRAYDAGIPAVVLPIGGSPAGQAMVAAHSGALAGGDAAWQAFCDAVGALRVRDLAELADTVEVFSTGRRSHSRASGIATVHDSGAERALAVDLAHDLGVEFASLSATSLAAIDELIDDGLMATNPLDVWGTGADTRALFRACLRVMTEDPAVAVTALAIDLVPEFDGDTAYPDAILDVAAESPAALAVLTSLPSAVDDDTARRLRAGGVAVLEGFRSGLVALGHLASWPKDVDRDHPPVDPQRRARWLSRLANWSPGWGFALLADYGIAVAGTVTVHDLDDAVGAADVAGYPVVLKTVAAEHKSDVGGVALDLGDAAAVRAAYADLAARLGPAVTVQPMVPGGVEVSVGVVCDATFGPLVVVAAGGTLVELLADRTLACPPVSPVGAMRLLDGLRLRPLLDGWRGSAAVDVPALADVIVGFATLATELGDAIEAVEANPVIASPKGAVAVDVLVIPRA